LAAKKIKLGTPRTSETGKALPVPTEPKFVVNKTVSKHAKDADIAFDNLVGQHDMQVRVLSGVLHPDSYPRIRFYTTRVMERSTLRNSRRLLMLGFNS